MTLAVPFFSYWLSFACNESTGCPPWPLTAFSAFHAEGYSAMLTSEWWGGMWSAETALVYLGWYAWCVACWAVLPGKMVQGGALRNGDKVTYPMNCEFSQGRVVCSCTTCSPAILEGSSS